MSQSTARHDPRGKSEEEDVASPQGRQPQHRQRARPRQPVGQPTGDDGVSPDEPDKDEFELIGGNDDLGPADLGPADPNFTDPDADSGRIRKIA
jgi:hypothetical protein